MVILKDKPRKLVDSIIFSTPKNTNIELDSEVPLQPNLDNATEATYDSLPFIPNLIPKLIQVFQKFNRFKIVKCFLKLCTKTTTPLKLLEQTVPQYKGCTLWYRHQGVFQAKLTFHGSAINCKNITCSLTDYAITHGHTFCIFVTESNLYK